MIRFILKGKNIEVIKDRVQKIHCLCKDILYQINIVCDEIIFKHNEQKELDDCNFNNSISNILSIDNSWNESDFVFVFFDDETIPQSRDLYEKINIYESAFQTILIRNRQNYYADEIFEVNRTNIMIDTNEFLILRFDLLKNIWKDSFDSLTNEEIRVVLGVLSILNIKNVYCMYTSESLNFTKNDYTDVSIYNRDFYISLKYILDESVHKYGYLDERIEKYVFSCIAERLLHNKNNDIACNELTEVTERKRFFSYCYELLSYIETKTIIEGRLFDGVQLNKLDKSILISLKNGNVSPNASFEGVKTVESFDLYLEGLLVSSINKEVIQLDNILYNDEKRSITILASTNGIYEGCNCFVEAYVNGSKLAKKAETGRNVTYFKKAVIKRFNYIFEIPFEDVESDVSVDFYFENAQVKYPLRCLQKYCNEEALNNVVDGNTLKIKLCNKLLCIIRFILDKNINELLKTIESVKNDKLYKIGQVKIVVYNTTECADDIGKILQTIDDDIEVIEPKHFEEYVKQSIEESIFFIDAGDFITTDYLFDGVSVLKSNNVGVVIPNSYIHEENGAELKKIKDKYIDLDKTATIFTECGGAIFDGNNIRYLDKGLIASIENNPIIEDRNSLYFYSALKNNHSLVVIGNHCYITERVFSTEGKLFTTSTQKLWYLPSIKNYFDILLNIYECSIPHYLQMAIMRSIYIKYAFNQNQKDTHTLNEKEIKEWFDKTKEILQFVDDDIIGNMYKTVFLDIKPHERLFFMWLKNPDTYATYLLTDGENLNVYCSGNLIVSSKQEKAQIELIEKEGNYLHIEFSTRGFFEVENLLPKVRLGDKEVETQRNYYYSHRYYFGKSMWKRYTFSLYLSLSEIDNNTLSVYYKYNGKEYSFSFSTNRFPSKLSSKVPGSYWICDQHILSFSKGQKEIVFEPYTKEQHQKYEKTLCENSLKVAKDKSKVRKVLKIRQYYWQYYERFNKKNIWISFDKMYKAGDNGEYFFRYLKNNDRKIIAKYIVNKGYPDSDRLVSEGMKPLFYGSLSHILYFLFAKVITATHANIPIFSGIDVDCFCYVQDLFNADIFCIQHGLAVQWMPHNLYAGYDNIKRFYCASPSEINNLKKDIYGYKPEQLKLTGVPRYDGLIRKEIKQILIIPTWRSYIAMPTSIGNVRPYSNNFKNTEYFRIYNSLIGNSQLRDTAVKHGYKIMYLLHPTLSSQIVDFVSDDIVSVISPVDISYEEVLTESDLMVTDYSGVQFDFAYMRKPILYYHPDELPPAYSEGGFSYEEQGFGPIIKDENSLVNELCRYIKNGCQIDEIYKDREDCFFKHSDHSNSERIYKDIIQFENQKNTNCVRTTHTQIELKIQRRFRDDKKDYLYWNSVPNASGYRVLVANEIDGRYCEIALVSEKERNYPLPSKYKFKWFKVCAYFNSVNNCGNYSNAIRGNCYSQEYVDLENELIDSSEILNAIIDKKGQLRLYWNGDNRVTSWRLYKKDNKTGQVSMVEEFINVCTWERIDKTYKPNEDVSYSIEAGYIQSNGEVKYTEKCKWFFAYPERIELEYARYNAGKISVKIKEDVISNCQIFCKYGIREKYELLYEGNIKNLITINDNMLIGKTIILKSIQDGKEYCSIPMKVK